MNVFSYSYFEEFIMNADINKINTLKKVRDLFYVVSDLTRLKILSSLIDETRCTCLCDNCADCSHQCCMVEKSVSEIIDMVELEQSLVSHQLKVLKDADIVTYRQVKNKKFYCLKDAHIKQLIRIAIAHVEEKND